MQFVKTVCKWAALALLTGVLFTASAQAPRPAGFPGEAPEGPPAQITRFEAEPSSIQPGESFTLRWTALNTYSMSISPGIGTVAARGSETLTPGATTTYTLAVTGADGEKKQSVTVTVAGTQPISAEENASASSQERPRLPDGQPDLSGVYMAGRDIRMAGGVTVKPGAENFRVPPREDDLGQGALCLPPGVPASTMMPYPLQIVHKQNVIVILYEAYNLFRIIPVRPDHTVDYDPTWMGNSIAYWEGDTLVVDVVGFNEETLVAGHRHTEEMHVVERYRPIENGGIAYEATVEDPNVFAAPVRYAGNFTPHPEWEIGEFVCAENNKDYDELFDPN